MNIESSQKLEQNKVSIVYAGTPVLSKKILEKLNENFEIKAVLTQPDKIRGRTKIPSLAPVAEFAVKKNIECIKIENFQQNNLLKLNNLKFDFLIVAAFGKIIPKHILNLPAKDSINIHFSLLPSYRGATPIQSAILSNDKITGISYMSMTEGMDEGPIYSSHELGFEKNENKITLENRLIDLTLKTVVTTIKEINLGNLQPKKQDAAQASYCKKITKSDGLIDFRETSEEIESKLRAYIEWPGLFFNFKNVQIKIHGCYAHEHSGNEKPGTILWDEKLGMSVVTNNSKIVITHLQFPGKNIIADASIKNGYKDFFNKKIEKTSL